MQDRRQSPIAIPPAPLLSASVSTPRRPTPQREQEPSDDTVRRVPSSYFSLPYSYSSPAGPSHWRNKPLDSGSARRRDGKGAFRSASVKTVGSFSLKTPNRHEDLDNWQSLQDITGSDVDEDQIEDKATTNSRSSSLATPSARSVRSLFISSDLSADALSIPEGRSHTSDRISIVDRLSLSPTQLEAGGDHILSVSREDSQEEEGTPRAAVLPLQSPEPIERLTSATPLLEASFPSDFLSPRQPITETRSIVEKKASILEGMSYLLLSFMHLLTSVEGHRYSWIPPTWATNILKCSIAYLIASLFTFVPALASMLSTQSETDAHGRVTAVPAYSAHMVATIVVYVSRRWCVTTC